MGGKQSSSASGKEMDWGEFSHQRGIVHDQMGAGSGLAAPAPVLEEKTQIALQTKSVQAVKLDFGLDTSSLDLQADSVRSNMFYLTFRLQGQHAQNVRMVMFPVITFPTSPSEHKLSRVNVSSSNPCSYEKCIQIVPSVLPQVPAQSFPVDLSTIPINNLRCPSAEKMPIYIEVTLNELGNEASSSMRQTKSDLVSKQYYLVAFRREDLKPYIMQHRSLTI
jgi:phage tail protein X